MDETAEIGNGTHERMVIDVARFSKRLAAKAKS
jgi:predicted thioesterase